MKIVFLIDYFQPKLGYQEFFLAKEIQNLGHLVFVVTSDYYFPFPDYQNTVYPILGGRKRKIGIFKEEGITVYRLPMRFQSQSGAVTLLQDLGKTLSKIKPNMVYSDGVFTPLAFQVAYYKRRIGYKLFYDSHTSTFNTKLRDTIIKKIYMFCFKKFLIPYIRKNADGFTAVGASEKILLCQEYNLKPTQVKLIPLGADISIFYPDSKKRKIMRQKLGIKNNEILIVHAGKITKGKDLDILFKAFLLVAKKFKNIKLLIISGGEKTYIDKLILFSKNNEIDKEIIWQGPVENELLAFFYNSADIGVWPGNLSNTILEAMACGLAVILPKVISKGQTSNHLFKNKNGLSFSRGNEKDLADKIRVLIRNKKMIKDMGSNSKDLIEGEFSWGKIAPKYLELYETV